MTASLDQKLADSKITQTEYDAQKTEVTTKAEEIVNNVHNGKGSHQGHSSKAARSSTRTSTTAALAFAFFAINFARRLTDTSL